MIATITVLKDMRELEITSGDIVRIKGGSDAHAIAWPSYPKEKGEGTVRIDGNIRNNAEVSIDEHVEIEKSKAKDAERVDVSPTQPIELVRGSEYMGKVLEGQPVEKGQQIRANILGATHTFLVKSTKPTGVVVVKPKTKINLSKKSIEDRRTFVTYEDIGGLERELERVREMIEIPLKNPNMFKKIGIEPPKGVLLHGPPGTGKTLISKAVANEVDANFYTISGPEIIGKLYGESEKRLREVFKKARANPPAVVLIDEIDAIAPKRSEMSGERMVERRVVNQLLSILDGLESRGEVMVIGATNQPNLLDPALRRGGRFDREIEIGIPDKEGRKEILEVHTRGMPLEDIDLDELSELTHGYVGADLETLCKEAAMRALRRIIPKMDLESGEIPPEVADTLEVSEEDFSEALKTTTPSAIKEVFTEAPDVNWKDVGGLERAKEKIRESVEWPLKYSELFNEYETETPKGILLHGPPGTGKTLLAKAVANESDANFISIKGPELLSKFVGESERGVREMFRKARQASPCVVFFDELDAIAPERSQQSDSQVTERVVSQVLTELDGLKELKDVVMIAATNRPDMIDRALLRPGRIDRLVYTPPPDEGERKEIFEVHLRNKRLTEDVDLDSIVERTENYVGADIAAVCREATMFAIREEIEGKRTESEEGAESRDLKQKHFEQALEEVEPSVSAEDLKSYEEIGKLRESGSGREEIG